MIDRKTFLKLTGAAAATGIAAPAWTQSPPLIQRFRVATLNTPDMKAAADWYVKWFDYKVRETGTIAPALASSWTTPQMAGKPFVLLSSDGSPDVYLRIVQGDKAPAFNPRSTYGWGSLEFIVDDLDAQFKKMKAGGVNIFRDPASLGGIFASIHAMQLMGPMDITHNMTVEKGDREKSNLPVAKSQVDRMFLVGVNGPDMKAISDFYVNTFRMTKGPDYDYPIPVLAEVLGKPKDYLFKLTLVRSAQKGNTLELHDLPPPGGPRPTVAGQLPPGVGLVSLGVKNLDEIKTSYLSAPAAQAGLAYKGKRSAVLKGAAGELIELIEEV
ncbi:MAG: hypothetical protein JNK21_06080 [Rhodospirillaceae bacterium]|nr:hypothetical protein [Rhodospirillaceae bacterium]